MFKNKRQWDFSVLVCEKVNAALFWVPAAMVGVGGVVVVLVATLCGQTFKLKAVVMLVTWCHHDSGMINKSPVKQQQQTTNNKQQTTNNNNNNNNNTKKKNQSEQALVVLLQLTAVDAFTFFDQATQKQLWLLTNKPQHFWRCPLRLPACFVVLVVAAVVAVVAVAAVAAAKETAKIRKVLVPGTTVHPLKRCGM